MFYYLCEKFTLVSQFNNKDHPCTKTAVILSTPELGRGKRVPNFSKDISPKAKVKVELEFVTQYRNPARYALHYEDSSLGKAGTLSSLNNYE